MLQHQPFAVAFSNVGKSAEIVPVVLMLKSIDLSKDSSPVTMLQALAPELFCSTLMLSPLLCHSSFLFVNHKHIQHFICLK